MSGLIERLLRLDPGEGRRGLLLVAYLFLIISSFVVSKSARDALFLERYAAIQLPYMDIAIALLVGVVVAIYIQIGRRTTLPVLQAGSLHAYLAYVMALVLTLVVLLWLRG